MDTNNCRVILLDILQHAEAQVSRWQKFRAYEIEGTRNLHGNKPYGVSQLDKTIAKWIAKRDAIRLALGYIPNTIY